MYYFLNYNVETKVLGIFPPFKIDIYEGLNFIHNKDVFDDEPNDKLLHNKKHVLGMELKKQAKLNDVLYSLVLPDKMILCERFYNFLLISNTMPFRVRLTEIKRGDENLLYHFINFAEADKQQYLNLIDFKNSIFYIVREYNRNYAKVKFKSDSDINTCKEQFYNLALKTGNAFHFAVEKLVLKENMNVDFFCLPLMHALNPIISENMKNSIEAQGFTGMTFEVAQGFEKKVTYSDDDSPYREYDLKTGTFSVNKEV